MKAHHYIFPLLLLCLYGIAQTVIPMRYDNISKKQIEPLNTAYGTVAHGAMGSTETFDVSAGLHHTGMLDANCTPTFINWPADYCRVELTLSQNLTGGFTWANPAGVVTDPPPRVNTGANKVTKITYESSTGGVVIFGYADYGELGQISFSVDNGNSPIATGVQAKVIEAPYSCTLIGVTMLSDVSTTTTIDILKDIYDNHPPLAGDSIVGAGTKPTITAGIKSQMTEAAMAGWTTREVAKGDLIKVNVISNDNAKHIDLSLQTIR